jgi:hypothetical protein
MRIPRTTAAPAYLRISGEHSRLLLFVSTSALALLPFGVYAQSTKAALFGTIHDASGATIGNTQITLVSTLTHITRAAHTDPSGAFAILDLEPDTYTLSAAHSGFATDKEQNLQLTARQQLRLELTLKPASVSTDVTVTAANTGALNTEDSSIAAALTPADVLALPANYRGNGSTSPLTVIQTLPGVQPDSATFPPAASSSPAPSVKFSIQGGLPSQSETTVDGISAQNLTTNNVQADAFPSAESIAEIRVDGVDNNAEYGQPGEITTVTKQGTSTLHGSAFWYFQNSGFDAIPFGATAATKPHKVANDFGGSAGGPVVLPHLYNGHDRTFFFATYEGLRFPESTDEQYLVPTVAMKAGNFSQETTALKNPFTGGAYANATLPAINASAQPFLSLFPDPNTGNIQSVAATLASGQSYNYLALANNSIGSNQFDSRIDQAFGSKAFLYGRFTFKNIAQTQPSALNLPPSNAIAQYRIFATSFNYTFTPNISNEVRFGFTLEQDGTTNSYDGAAVTNAAGFTGIGPSYPFQGVTYLGFTQLTGVGGRLTSTESSRLFQYVDNLTWQRGAHTLRFGADIRTLQANTPLDFSNADNYGNFFFNPTTFTGQEFADFLIGAPYQSQTDDVTSENRGHSNAYAFYAQDNYRATARLNLTFGLRYEFHPAFFDAGGNIGNFDPSVPLSGRVIYPAGFASELSPEDLANFNACPTAGVNNPYATGGTQNGAPCTPVLSNTEAGIPAGLRYSPKLRFMPRFGFAYRPFGGDRTVVSGGVGYYNITTSGAIFYALTGTLQSNVQTFNNVETSTGPAFTFPNVSATGTNTFAPQYGSESFNSAVDIHWHDPYSLQTALSLEHEFNHELDARLSYIALHTTHLVWQPNLNDLPLSSTTLASAQPASAFPFPNFQSIANRSTSANANYNSVQAQLNRRFSHGLSFTAAYTYAKNLSDDQGTLAGTSPGTSSSFADEQGGYYGTYAYDRALDYGNVAGTRRQRLLLTGLTDIPYGHGRRFGGNTPRIVDTVLGGWQITNIFVDQTGPFLTPYIPSGNADPSGTGSGILFSRNQRPDRVFAGTRTLSANTSSQSRHQWFNTAAFACPDAANPVGDTGGFAALQAGACTTGVTSAPIGRFGTSSVGDVEGPGTVNLSTGLNKTVAVTERLHLRAEGTFTNILNHTNLADPILDTTSPAFGTITQARGSDFGGNRTGQVSLKLQF